MHLPEVTVQQSLSALAINIPPPVHGIPTTTGHLPPNNMQLSGCTEYFLMESKNLELQLLNAQIKKDEMLLKLREQELRDTQATPLSSDQQQLSSNR